MVEHGWTRAAAAGLSFRPAAESDLPFLARVYASTRLEELAPVSWSEAQKAAFLDSQFHAQHTHYRQNYPAALWLVIMRAGEAIGRVYLDRWAREHRLIDIALLPEHRGRGYGTALLCDLIAEAGAAGKALSIHVEKTNPALTLYRRLGFKAVGEHGIYDLLQVHPAEAQVNTAS
jgi:ribosomal protein S18 acetylase RimI-like enzyme